MVARAAEGKNDDEIKEKLEAWIYRQKVLHSTSASPDNESTINAENSQRTQSDAAEEVTFQVSEDPDSGIDPSLRYSRAATTPVSAAAAVQVAVETIASSSPGWEQN